MRRSQVFGPFSPPVFVLTWKMSNIPDNAKKRLTGDLSVQNITESQMGCMNRVSKELV